MAYITSFAAQKKTRYNSTVDECYSPFRAKDLIRWNALFMHHSITLNEIIMNKLTQLWQDIVATAKTRRGRPC